VGQKHAMDERVGPLTYNACRFVISTLLLFSVKNWLQSVIESNISGKADYSRTLANRVVEKARNFYPFEVSTYAFSLCFWSTLCGIGNFAANQLLQIGMISTSAGKAAFIVGLYVVLIPTVEQFLPGTGGFCLHTWLAAGICMVGGFFLSGCVDAMTSSDGESCADKISSGDVLVFFSMIAFSLAFMASDIAAKRTDCIDLTCMSFLVTTILCTASAMYYESDQWVSWPPLTDLLRGWDMVLMVGISEPAALLLGTLGQMYTPPSRAALLTSLEAPMSVLLAYLFLHEVLSHSEVFGCGLMFLATVVSTAVLEDDEEDDDEDDDDEEDIPDDGTVESLRRRKARNIRRRRRHFRNVFRRRTRSFTNLLDAKRSGSLHLAGGLPNEEYHVIVEDDRRVERSVSAPDLIMPADDAEYVMGELEMGIGSLDGSLIGHYHPFADQPIEPTSIPDADSDISTSPVCSLEPIGRTVLLDMEIPPYAGEIENSNDKVGNRLGLRITTPPATFTEYSRLLEIPPYSPEKDGKTKRKHAKSYGT